jgi:hypothetical protein
MTDKQKLYWYKKNIIQFYNQRPLYFIGYKVRIIDFDYSNVNEVFDNGEWKKLNQSWTWLDPIRSDKLGKVGEIIKMEFRRNITRPYNVSLWSYFVRFKDGKKIMFCEENLKRT